MIRDRWDETKLQEYDDKYETLSTGCSYGEGVERPRRPIGFGHEYPSVLSEGVR